MSKLMRLAAVFLCVGVLALGVVFFDPACPLTYPAPWDPIRRDSMAETLARNEQLKQLREASFRRIEAKWQIAKEVIAGRRSLAEALEQFRTLDRQWPENFSFQTPEDFGMSEDEWDGRAVIEQVRQVLADRPDEAAVVADRLEQELQQLLADRNKRPPAPADPRTERSRGGHRTNQPVSWRRLWGWDGR
jgi:hypothetical protein